ncbi:MAG: tRNA dihydrouridine(20/20a) synthase DusA [Alphaproteobacteria bacterium]|nr:tRNA dihydrouridine(20/20a) synthase DusA [Alphaproteobacteria bacterium]
MIDWTDRHCRYFHRQLSPHAVLYTEMITAPAILHGDQERLLGFSNAEHPVVLQLGGSDPAQLARAAKIGADAGYDAINLNCGCPSDRVQQGKFGACLMAEPSLVADCIKEMQNATGIPVTVKCRIGIDDAPPEIMLRKFVENLVAVGCDMFIIHARKAWLKGLSPKENREIPPLDYKLPALIKHEYGVKVILNGGIKTVQHVRDHLEIFDGVMIGREAYQNPWFIAELEHEIYQTPLPCRLKILEKMCEYMTERAAQTDTHSGTPIKSITRHMLGLFNGMAGAKTWRRILGGEAHAATNAHDFIMPLAQQILSHNREG